MEAWGYNTSLQSIASSEPILLINSIAAAYQTEDASSIFAPFARNATGGSASINEDKTEPPKQ